MKIDHSNYEEFMADYLEGNLEGAALIALEEFLERHPELIPDQELMHNYNLIPEERSVNKGQFLRTFDDISRINAQNFEELCVAYTEGDLSDEMQKKLLDFAESKAYYKNMLLLYQKMRFSPDTVVVFQGKSGLIRRTIPRTLYYTIASVAAAAVIFLMLVINWSKPPTGHQQSIAVEQPLEQKHINTVEAVNEKKKPEKTRNKPIVKELMQPYKTSSQLATFDTNDQRKQDKVVLAQIEPIAPSIPETVLYPKDNLKARVFSYENEDTHGVEKIVEKVEEQYYAIKTSKLSLVWQAIHAGITGINKMTENDIELHTTTDQKGNVTQFALGNGKFGVYRTIRKNEQN